MISRRILLAGVAVLLASCGTRVGEKQPAAARTPALGLAADSNSPAGRTGETGALPPAQTVEAPRAQDAAPPSARSIPAAGRGSGPGSVPQSPTPPTGVGGSPAPGKSSDPKQPATAQPAAPSAGLPLPAPVANASTALIATAGSLSGPVGAVFLPVLQGVQVWVQYINQRGGVNGHPVKLIVYDDGVDPARHRSQVQEAIEVKRVIAFVGNPEGISGQPSQEYVTSKRVPVIGSETGSDHFYKSPMFFPQAAHGVENFRAGLKAAAQAAVPAGKVKLATLACVEAQACSDADRLWADESPSVGFQPVYRARASLTQPDFTAECIAAQNAGAQFGLIGLDAASIGRLAASCARQGYKLLYATFSALIVDRMKDDPNLDGMVGASNVFPYFQTGTPAVDEYHEAMRAFGSRVAPGIGSAVGWVAAKLFEKAAAHLPEPPTSEAVLAGLWSIHDDTLGGLTQPLTFVKDQPAPRMACWFNVTVKNRQWVSPDAFTRHC